MKATVLPNGNLEISVDSEEREELRIAQIENEDFDSDAFMYDLFESLVCNSEYEWAADGEIALTDAPILVNRIWGEVDEELEPVDYPQAISEAWGFMDYAIISVQEQLLNDGKAIFIKG